jgi:ATP-dependent 26S proteasome regulatory subunit
MRFIIHFPFPAEEDRARIWQKVFPEKAPLGDVDFHWLAKHLKISGGNIKNISLRAAFMAIERHGKIDMDCLIEAAQREMDKIGKISALAEFRVRPPHAETIQVAEVA